MLDLEKEKFKYVLNKIKTLLSKKYDKTGGTLNTTEYNGLKLKRANSNNGGSAISFENANGVLGRMGFNSNKAFTVTKATGQDGQADLLGIEKDGTVNFFNEVIVSKSSGATYFRFRRTDTGVGIRFGVALNGTKAGLYSENLEKWILSCEGNDIVFDGKASSASVLTDETTTVTATDIGNISTILDAINGEVI
jgi:hypothetical protein